MRTSTIARALPLLLGALLACDADGVLAPPPGLAHAVASATCGPTDGQAVAVLLALSALASASPTRPHIRLNVWRSVADLVGTWSLASSSAQGSAARIGPAGGVVDMVTHGSITVLSVLADGTVIGHVDVVFGLGDRVRGGFRARWMPAMPMCG